MSYYPEKRRWLRFLLDLIQNKTICSILVNGKVDIEAGLRDMSRRGARLQNLTVYAGLELNDTVLFRKISTAGDISILRCCSGRVRWINPETDEFGVEFEEPLPYGKMSRRLFDILSDQHTGTLVFDPWDQQAGTQHTLSWRNA